MNTVRLYQKNVYLKEFNAKITSLSREDKDRAVIPVFLQDLRLPMYTKQTDRSFTGSAAKLLPTISARELPFQAISTGSAGLTICSVTAENIYFRVCFSENTAE